MSKPLPETITILHPNSRQHIEVKTADYIASKTQSLREFGYDNLRKEDVAEQLGQVLNKGKHVRIIGEFIRRDLVIGD